ncbi:helix-turn-helix transcriptional regulator [Marinobacterium sedimentorum]|uniref:helix-turn-helix transcriptional regulator n=1 Tax=Marinobacterium sedimentorum TaxID=2927804 RepID=UPI0020C74471|nr:WYL domain-containing protein [Marinobacterium sedimentorum]MCP8687146.1 WYL domain-containing protein [Marinobacterium sedimentorum]
MGTEMDTISQAQRERLFYIEFRLRFFGIINRQDMELRFEIRPAAATRDFRLYKTIAPGNLVYDPYSKAYVRSANFTPCFDLSCDQALTGLCAGLGDDAVVRAPAAVSADSPFRYHLPDVDILAAFSRAIYQGKPVSMQYLSVSTGCSERTIVPHALVDSGVRWHVRGYDRNNHRFSDFVLNRVQSVTQLAAVADTHEVQVADEQWNLHVLLELVPHPALRHPEVIEAEYGMKDGVARLQVRSAMAGYLMRLWDVDCGAGSTVNSNPSHLLALNNREHLSNVASLVLAPNWNQTEALTTGNIHG